MRVTLLLRRGRVRSRVSDTDGMGDGQGKEFSGVRRQRPESDSARHTVAVSERRETKPGQSGGVWGPGEGSPTRAFKTRVQR